MPRPPVRATERLAKAEELGRLKAQAEMTKKRHKLNMNSLYESLREHLGKIIDNTKINDWADIIAALGLTPLVYNSIIASEKTVTAIATAIGAFAQTWGGASLIALIMKSTGLGAIFNAIQEAQKTDKTATGGFNFATMGEIQTWLLAFAIAYMVVRFGDKMISASITGFSAILGLIGIA